MHKIQKLSRCLILLFNSMMVAAPPFLMVTWAYIDSAPLSAILQQGFIFFDTPFLHTPEGWANLSKLAWTPQMKAMGLLADGILLAPLYVSLFFLRKIFKNYQQGKVFTIPNALAYRALGVLFFVYGAVAKPVAELLMGLVATLSNPPGHRYLVLKLGTPTLEALFCGVLLIVISWVMAEASRLQEEHKLVI